MDPVRSKDGTRIAFDRIGEGPPVVFVGGAFSWRKWKGFLELADLLSSRYTVLNYDRRGRGDSGDAAPYAPDREFEDLEAMIAAAGGSAYVWGLSSGGILALEAVRAGVAIEKLALYEPPFIVDRADGVPPDDYRAHLDQLIDAGRRSDAVKYFMAKVMGMPAIVPSLMRMWPPMWSKLKATAPTLVYDAALLEGHARGHAPDRADWADVATPTLVVSGKKSPEKLRKGASAIAAVLPNAELRELEGVSHNVKMKVLAPVLAEFFSDGGRLGAAKTSGRQVA